MTTIAVSLSDRFPMPPRPSRICDNSPDCESRLEFEAPLRALLPRAFRPMHPQTIIVWTPSRLLRTFTDWRWNREQLRCDTARRLSVSERPGANEVKKAARSHVLAETELVGTFETK